MMSSLPTSLVFFHHTLIHSFTHSFTQTYLLSAYYIQSTVLDTEDKVVNKSDKNTFLPEVCTLVEGDK